MKVGMISFAHMHAFAYVNYLDSHPEAEIAAIWDENSDRGKEMAGKYHCAFYPDLHEMLESDIEAVVVCSENAKHKDHVVAAARAKKHILCEKPIATEVADAREMIDCCEKEGVIFQIAYPVRFGAAVEQAKEMVQSGEIGDVVAINGTNHGQMPGGWFIEKELSGGGSATDHIVHIMDLIRWMLRDEAKTVYAELDTRFYDIAVEDCGMVTLELESGVIVSIDPSWSRPKTFPSWGDVTMKIVGTKGTLHVDALKQHAEFYNDRDGKVQHLPWAEDTDECLIDDFIRCVQEGRKPSVTGEDGLRTLEVVKAAYESSQTGKVVELQRT
ncbi:MAG TPA: Gfo/Idh/MocA family oxidoreductase [Bacillales bacterium]|nr:Gfo/Idh/MocA family oxidoreductase [Bacillales bacterium]